MDRGMHKIVMRMSLYNCSLDIAQSKIAQSKRHPMRLYAIQIGIAVFPRLNSIILDDAKCRVSNIGIGEQ